MSRFVYADVDRPKNLAKKLRRTLRERFAIDLPLNKSQDLVARMLGHDDWFAMGKAMAIVPATPFDRNAPDHEVVERFQQQCYVLRELIPDPESIVRELAMTDRAHRSEPESEPWHGGYCPWGTVISTQDRGEGVQYVKAVLGSGLRLDASSVHLLPTPWHAAIDQDGAMWFEDRREDCILVGNLRSDAFSRSDQDQAWRDIERRYDDYATAVLNETLPFGGKALLMRPHMVRHAPAVVGEFFSASIGGLVFKGVVEFGGPHLVVVVDGKRFSSVELPVAVIDFVDGRSMPLGAEQKSGWAICKYDREQARAPLASFDRASILSLAAAIGIHPASRILDRTPLDTELGRALCSAVAAGNEDVLAAAKNDWEYDRGWIDRAAQRAAELCSSPEEPRNDPVLIAERYRIAASQGFDTIIRRAAGRMGWPADKLQQFEEALS